MENEETVHGKQIGDARCHRADADQYRPTPCKRTGPMLRLAGREVINVASSTLSHHLKQLSECELLQSRKEGTFIYYSLNRRVVEKYSHFLLT